MNVTGAQSATVYTRRAALAALVLFGCADLSAAEGAFRGIAWLPDPGWAPDHIGYPLDRTDERLRLFFHEDGGAKLDACLVYAREKLSEVHVMVRTNEPGFAWVSAGLYNDYIARAARTIDRAAGQGQLRAEVDTRLRLASALLEHAYIVSEEYAALPLDIREFALLPLVNSAMLEFDNQRNLLGASAAAQLDARRDQVRAGLARMHELDRRRVVETAP